MTSGFLLGAGAAVAWGVADILVAQAARRAGFFHTTLVVQASGVVVLALLALALGEAPDLSGPQWAAVAGLGALSVAAFLGFYKALELGPIAIVSPIASTSGAIVVLLAVIVLGEAVSALHAIGIALVLVFVVIAAAEPAAARSTSPSGIRLAVISAVVFGLFVFLLATLADELGWLLPTLLTRTVAVALMGAYAAVRPRRDGAPAVRRATLIGCVAAGTLDAAGYLLFNRGAELGEVAITGAAASSYPLIPILVGLLGFRERVAWYQLVGVAGVLVGMVVLSLG